MRRLHDLGAAFLVTSRFLPPSVSRESNWYPNAMTPAYELRMDLGLSRRIGAFLTLTVALLAATGTTVASEWRQFRGPDGAGKSADPMPPMEWNSEENLLWRVALPGPGSSSPIVTGNRVFVTCYSGYGVDSRDPGEMEALKRHLVCVDRQSGKVLWNRPVPARLPEDPYRGYIGEHGYASNTPVTNGSQVFVFFGKTGVLAFDFDGDELWRTEVGQESSNRRWGSAASLVLHGQSVIVNASDESQSIRALEQATGKEIWKAEASSLELAYGTPVLAKSASGELSLLISVPNEVWGLDPDEGKLRWYADTGLPGNICPTLVALKGVAYGFGGYPSQGSFAVKIGGKGDRTADSIVWKSRVSSYVASPVIHQGHLYWVTDRGEAFCMQASDGKVRYQERLPGLSTDRRSRAMYASVVVADDRVYAVSRYGGTFVLPAKPEFEVLAHNQFANDASQFNGTPAFADNQIYLRSDQYLYAVGK